MQGRGNVRSGKCLVGELSCRGPVRRGTIRRGNVCRDLSSGKCPSGKCPVGEMSGYPTEHAILQLINEITENFSKNEYTLGVFIDLSKAFDTVNHEILLKKLEYYGIKDITNKWLLSYLTNRKQSITYNNKKCESDFLTIKCGVPQGSILGPLLFLIYVNDLCKASSEISAVMFADDTNLFLSNKNITNLFTTMNTELKKITEWFKANKLSLNVSKTKYSLFHQLKKKKHIPVSLPFLKLNNIKITRDTSTKFLGVLLDENLSWKAEIESVELKISKSIGILYKAKGILNNFLLKQLYSGFVHSYLAYANIAWASTHKSKLQAFFRRQKHAIRLINSKDRLTHTKPLFKEMNILTVYEINIYQVLNFMVTCKMNTSPKTNLNHLISIPCKISF